MGVDLQRAMALVLAAGGLDDSLRAFVVEGEPIAKARARFNGKRTYTPQTTRTAEEHIAWKARAGVPHRFDGNVAVAAIFYRSNRHRIDTDNLLKTVLDGITKSGAVWVDDSHVTALVGVVELDASAPRTVIAIAPHSSTLQRGDDANTHVCVTCGKRYRPHGSIRASFYCSRACRQTRVCVCQDCGGTTSAPHVKRCRSCHKNRGTT